MPSGIFSISDFPMDGGRPRCMSFSITFLHDADEHRFRSLFPIQYASTTFPSNISRPFASAITFRYGGTPSHLRMAFLASSSLLLSVAKSRKSLEAPHGPQ